MSRLYGNKIRIIISSSLLLPLLLCGILSFPAPAKAEPLQTVKVGYYENEVFEEGAGPGAVKTGYAYEYYRKLSEYTGWHYEYVYGSFGELYDMLLSGQIDLLAGLAKREDRLDLIGYPFSPMGNETYSLVKHDDDASVTWSFSSVSGKKIGVLKSAVESVLEEFLENNGIEAEIIPFDDYEMLFRAFDEKEIDILAAEGDGAYGREHSEVIGSFGSSDYYLCVNLKRTDLLDELNSAQSLLAVEEPNYLNSLQSKYYSSSVSSHAFSAAEREWMEGNQSLKVGYLNNYLPYSAADSSGNVTGMVKELLPSLFSEVSLADLDITYTGYDNFDNMIEDIRAEKIDVAFPVGGGLYYSEENGIYQSCAVTSSTTDLVYAGDYDNEDALHFAVNENNRMQYYYIRTNFPNSEIEFYPSIDACLEAVQKGEAGATTLNGLRGSEILKNSHYRNLYLKQLAHTDDRCFGVKIGNEGLLKLLNRGVNILGTEYVQEIANHYTDQLYTYTLRDMIRDNIWLFLFLLLIIALFVITLIVRDLNRTRRADRQKTDFVSHMSHEIRTPITAILGMNEMIQRESSDESILQYSDKIEKAGESLLGIINDILDFSKIEAGRMELSLQPYSLPELLSDLDLMVRMRAEEKKLKFSMSVDEKLPVMPVGDLQKLRQIMTNILTNAVKYTEKGEVKLTLKLLSLSGQDFTMMISVEDTGIGIKEEEMGKLYSAFDRLDLERTRSIEGSGLGLTITRQMLALMGSRIDVKSEYGKGSCFSFCLKQGITDPSPIGPYEASSSTPDLRKRRRTPTFTAPEVRLLIVDDTPMNLEVLCGLLKGNGMRIDKAQSGEECIELFLKNSYDAVFLDQRMPNMDGVETLRELQKRDPEKAKNTPVISLTANAFATAKEEMLKAGFTDYLTKPVNLYDLENMLLKHLPEKKICKIQDSDSAVPENSLLTDTPEDSLPEEVQKIELLDCESGIDYCGDPEEYLEALKIYRSSVKEKSGQLEELLHNQDTEALSLLLHSLKSTSGAVGASELALSAEKLEHAAKDGDFKLLQNGVPDFISQYRFLGARLEEALQSIDP